MSQHSSLKSKGTIKKRNVLKRGERVKVLAARKSWKEGDSAYGLPKTKVTL